MSAAVPAGISVQARLSNQRERLLALDYHDPVTAESLALVERLFEDLVTTTESYEDLQQRVRVKGNFDIAAMIAECLVLQSIYVSGKLQSPLLAGQLSFCPPMLVKPVQVYLFF